ncbi:MAG: hypothetical protein VKQ33_16675, partial [Candidatus Sericytochromatia bacterium]|nr:hypothetical protein [Candidatus Sericytochromatia bacterium]
YDANKLTSHDMFTHPDIYFHTDSLTKPTSWQNRNDPKLSAVVDAYQNVHKFRQLQQSEIFNNKLKRVTTQDPYRPVYIGDDQTMVKKGGNPPLAVDDGNYYATPNKNNNDMVLYPPGTGGLDPAQRGSGRQMPSASHFPTDTAHHKGGEDASFVSPSKLTVGHQYHSDMAAAAVPLGTRQRDHPIAVNMTEAPARNGTLYDFDARNPFHAIGENINEIGPQNSGQVVPQDKDVELKHDLAGDSGPVLDSLQDLQRAEATKGDHTDLVRAANQNYMQSETRKEEYRTSR